MMLTRPPSVLEDVLKLFAESSALTHVHIRFYDHTLKFLCRHCAELFDHVVSALAKNPSHHRDVAAFLPVENDTPRHSVQQRPRAPQPHRGQVSFQL
ncbi:hypothetical protein MRX96_021784 [Rhipicephalus microplus]